MSDFIGVDVSGVYDLKEKCGTAMNSLHVKRQMKEKGKEERELFFFLDPHRYFSIKNIYIKTQTNRKKRTNKQTKKKAHIA
jgi:hypothetical protein